MGVLSAVARWLGIRAPLVPREPEPFGLSDAALAALANLPPGSGLRVVTSPLGSGRAVRVDAAPLAPMPADRVSVTGADRERLRGLYLDFKNERWSVGLSLRLDAADTPNPHGRLYLADRPLLRGRPRFFRAGDANLSGLPARLLAIPGVVSVLFRDHTFTLEREGACEGGTAAPWDGIDAAADAALREHLLLCGGEVPAADAPADDPLHSEIMAVLAERILPVLHRDGGDLELIGVADGVVRVHLVGACRSCPASTTTLKLGVERALLEALPGKVREVISV